MLLCPALPLASSPLRPPALLRPSLIYPYLLDDTESQQQQELIYFRNKNASVSPLDPLVHGILPPHTPKPLLPTKECDHEPLTPSTLVSLSLRG